MLDSNVLEQFYPSTWMDISLVVADCRYSRVGIENATYRNAANASDIANHQRFVRSMSFKISELEMAKRPVRRRDEFLTMRLPWATLGIRSLVRRSIL